MTEYIKKSIEAHNVALASLQALKQYIIDDDIMESVETALEDIKIEVESIIEETQKIEAEA